MQKDEWKESSQEMEIKQVMQGLLFHIKEFGLHIGSRRGWDIEGS